jgi:type IV fimbrial biogenesis protein FimT
MMRRLQHGMSIIELMIGVAIMGVLLALAGPSFATWIQNSQIRTSAESIQNGLQLARSDAVRRNKNIRFQFTSTVDSSCVISGSGSSWVISQNDPSGNCDADASETAAPPDPLIIQSRSGKEGSANAIINSTQPLIAFNSLGRVTPVPGADISIDIQHADGCAYDSSGDKRCLRVVVTTAGQIRMCDPKLPSSNAQGC